MAAVIITFVGTASGKTSRTRNHSSLYVQTTNNNLLIDCGDGISKALLNLDLEFNSIDSILLTHNHADHFSGISALITQMKLAKRTNPLKIYSYKYLTPKVKEILELSYLFKEKLNFELEIVPFDFATKNKLSEEITFTAKQNSHITQTDILKNYPSEIFVSVSLLLKLGSKKIFYTSDIGSVDDLFLFENEKPDWLISETTHVNLDTIFSAHQKLGTGRLYLTHYDDNFAHEFDHWQNNLSQDERNSINICYDGMKIYI
jgi:ribonuclease Z